MNSVMVTLSIAAWIGARNFGEEGGGMSVALGGPLRPLAIEARNHARQALIWAVGVEARCPPAVFNMPTPNDREIILYRVRSQPLVVKEEIGVLSEELELILLLIVGERRTLGSQGVRSGFANNKLNPEFHCRGKVGFAQIRGIMFALVLTDA